ncbi:MAG: hypothetical protein A2V66_11420 [Ignavibacteria bacterium RBG_13_36_8]|nr:MAG: hypothetical protein A2V66_11420 [Ignavibacteria bacterium RBG_13_36_8]
MNSLKYLLINIASLIKRIIINKYSRNFIFSLLLQLTPPTKPPNTNLKTEIVSKIGHIHVKMFIMAIKSFSFFSGLSLCTTCIDDGTLTNKDKIMLKNQIIGITLIQSGEAKERILLMLKNHPFCIKYRNETHKRLYTHNTALFDLPLLATKEKIIIIDADILFFRKSTEIVNWVYSNRKYCHHMAFPECHTSKVFRWGRLILWVLAHELKSDIPIVFNDGILCTYKSVYDLDRVEKYINRIYSLKLQNEWISLVVILSELYTNLQKHNNLPVYRLNTGKYVILTQCNQQIRHNVLSGPIAVHYIAQQKFIHITADSIKLLLKTRCFRKYN